MVDLATDVPLVAKAVTMTARRAARSHRGYVELDDLTQEAWLWVYTHVSEIHTRLESEEPQRALESWVQSRLRTHLHRYCMRQRYQQDGTNPSDYFRYTTSFIEALLPDVFDEEPSSNASHDVNVTRGRRAPNEGFEYAATVADIARAAKQLSVEDYTMLSQRYADGGLSTEVLAIAYDVTQRAIQARLQRIIRRLAAHLDW